MGPSKWDNSLFIYEYIYHHPTDTSSPTQLFLGHYFFFVVAVDVDVYIILLQLKIDN